MTLKKIAVLFSGLLIAAFLVGWRVTLGTETKPAVTEIKTQMPDVSPEVREKAFGLLNEVLAESETLKGDSSKLQIQIEIADLLWEKDETKARTIFSTVSSKAEEEDCLCEISTDENIQKIAARDSKIAMQIKYFVPEGETMDIIFETFLKQYPEETLEKSKASLANNFADNFFRKSGYESYNERRKGILDRLELIYAQNSKNGADFAKAILLKLKDNKLDVRFVDNNRNSTWKPANTVNYSNSNTYSEKKYATNTSLNSVANTLPDFPLSNSKINSYIEINNIDFSKVREFFGMTIASKESAAKGQTQMLAESELGELARLMVNALITAKRFNSYEIQGIYSELKKYAPTEMAKLEKTISVKQLREIKQPRVSVPGFKSGTLSGSSIKKIPIPLNETPAEKEEREFVDNVHYTLSIPVNYCNIEEDAITYARIPNKNKYPDLAELFENYMPAAMAKIGNVKELRKYLKKETDNAKKIELLSLAADAVTAPKDKNDLTELLKELNITVPKQYKNVTEFKVMMNYAKILSATSPALSFDIIESLLNDANGIINSAAIIAEFNEDESQENGEFRFMKMQEQFAKNSPLTIGMIKKLAHFDFERTKKLADKFTRPEVHLFIKWHIANSLLNKNAPTEEAKFYEVEICG